MEDNTRSTPDRRGESELRHPIDIDLIDVSPVVQDKIATRALVYGKNGLQDVEYMNRKLQLVKSDPTGPGRLNPLVREYNRNELSRLREEMQAHAGTISSNQLEQVLLRGSNADFDGNELNNDGMIYSQLVHEPYAADTFAHRHVVLPSPAGGIPPVEEKPFLMTPMPGFPIDELVNLPRFIMNDIAPFAFVNEPEHVPDNLRMPYKKILFELGPEEDRHLIVATQWGEHMIALEYLHTDRETPFLIGAMSGVQIEKDGTMSIGLQPYSTDTELAYRCTHAIIGFIAEFSVGNTVIGTQAKDPNRVIPPAGTTRKYRIVRVVMGVTTIRKPWQGGTHASPREHERMGHWRRVKGEPRWFPPVTVNKGVIGRAMKEYHISKKKPSPATQGPAS